MNRTVQRSLDAVIVTALTVAIALIGIAWHQSTTAHIALDMDGRRVALDTRPDPAGADVQATGGRFHAPGQGLDVPLLEMSASGGVLNPPTLTDAFILRDPDRTTADGVRPRIIVMHAVHGGRAPGNALITTGGTATKVLVGAGDQLWVDGVEYVVESTDILSKPAAASSSDIWGYHEDGADRITVITCRPDNRAAHATHNLVVHAVRT